MEQEEFDNKLIKIGMASTYKKLVEAILSIDSTLLSTEQIKEMQTLAKKEKMNIDRIEEEKKKDF